MYQLCLEVADILFLIWIECKVADWSNETVDTKCDVTENEVSPGSGSEACGLKSSVVDDYATNPSEEECEQEANEVVVIHNIDTPFYLLILF